MKLQRNISHFSGEGKTKGDYESPAMTSRKI